MKTEYHIISLGAGVQSTMLGALRGMSDGPHVHSLQTGTQTEAS
jgi:hypothetical protein